MGLGSWRRLRRGGRAALSRDRPCPGRRSRGQGVYDGRAVALVHRDVPAAHALQVGAQDVAARAAPPDRGDELLAPAQVELPEVLHGVVLAGGVEPEEDGAVKVARGAELRLTGRVVPVDVRVDRRERPHDGRAVGGVEHGRRRVVALQLVVVAVAPLASGTQAGDEVEAAGQVLDRVALGPEVLTRPVHPEDRGAVRGPRGEGDRRRLRVEAHVVPGGDLWCGLGRGRPPGREPRRPAEGESGDQEPRCQRAPRGPTACTFLHLPHRPSQSRRHARHLA